MAKELDDGETTSGEEDESDSGKEIFWVGTSSYGQYVQDRLLISISRELTTTRFF
jgi:hypothetical protein